jgi:hypothetical protein
MPRRKEPSEALNQILRVRFKKIEVDSIKESAESWGMTVSAYIRALSTNSAPKKPPVTAIDRKAYSELGRIGNNLNQIAKQMNQAHGIFQGHEELAGDMEELRVYLNRVRLALMTR